MKTTNVHIILDQSGSMMTVRAATISGFNEYLQTLRKEKKVSYKLSLTLFNTETDKRYLNEPLKNVKDLTEKTYVPDEMTALYDAVCQTVGDVEKKSKKNQRHVVVIMTDGEENSSREYSEKNFREVVERLQKKGNWTFTYLGANQDSWANASNWGFERGNVANYEATDLGTQAAFYSAASATNAVSASSLRNTKEFYSNKK